MRFSSCALGLFQESLFSIFVDFAFVSFLYSSLQTDSLIDFSLQHRSSLKLSALRLWNSLCLWDQNMGLGALCCWMGATLYLRRWQRAARPFRARKRPGRESQEEEMAAVLDTAVK